MHLRRKSDLAITVYNLLTQKAPFYEDYTSAGYIAVLLSFIQISLCITVCYYCYKIIKKIMPGIVLNQHVFTTIMT